MARTLADIEPSTRKAIERFVAEVLSRQKDNILRIVLFGSVARGEDNEDSDIDVFLLVKNDSQNREAKDDFVGCSIVADEENDYKTYIAPLSMSLERYARNERIGFPITRNIKKDGIVLYEATDADKTIDEAISLCGVEDDGGLTLISPYIERSRKWLKTCEMNTGSPDFLVSASYHSAIGCATALLLSKKMEISSNKKTPMEFYRAFVETGEFPKEIGNYLMELEKGRYLADETLFMFKESEAVEFFRKARLFYDATIEKLREVGFWLMRYNSNGGE